MSKLFNTDETYTPRAQNMSDTVAGFVAGCIDSCPDLTIREIQIICIEAVQDACLGALVTRQQNAAKEFLRKKFSEMPESKTGVASPPSEEEEG